MCSNVIIHEGNENGPVLAVCETQGDLAEFLGEENVILRRHGDGENPPLDPSCCLCPLDGPETARRIGGRWIPVNMWRDSDGMDDPFDEHLVVPEGFSKNNKRKGERK